MVASITKFMESTLNSVKLANINPGDGNNYESHDDVYVGSGEISHHKKVPLEKIFLNRDSEIIG